MADAKIDGVQMLPYLPFLISTNSFGIIAVLIFMGTSLIFMIPVFATRGGTQMIWFATVGFGLTVLAVGLTVLVVLVNNGTIWQS